MPTRSSVHGASSKTVSTPRPRAPTPWSIRRGAVMAERLPATLRAYRRLAAAAMPFTPLVLHQRMRRGKEDPERIGERRGEARIPRPQGPLVWVHGASVGELVAVLPLVERIRGRGFNVLVTSGTTTSAELADRRLPSGVIQIGRASCRERVAAWGVRGAV